MLSLPSPASRVSRAQASGPSPGGLLGELQAGLGGVKLRPTQAQAGPATPTRPTGGIPGVHLLRGTATCDIGLDHFSRISQLRPTLHALCAVFYLVRMLLGG